VRLIGVRVTGGLEEEGSEKETKNNDSGHERQNGENQQFFVVAQNLQ
jgi:hypothetical protein